MSLSVNEIKKEEEKSFKLFKEMCRKIQKNKKRSGESQTEATFFVAMENRDRHFDSVKLDLPDWAKSSFSNKLLEK